MWTPYLISLVLHYHCSPYRFKQCEAPIYKTSIDNLIDCGVLEPAGLDGDGNEYFQTTDLGTALVDMWRKTPLPVLKYTDPRLGEGSHAVGR